LRLAVRLNRRAAATGFRGPAWARVPPLQPEHSLKAIYQNIAVTLATAERELKQLLAAYEASLSGQHVSVEAIQLTHDLCGHLRSVLDRIARRYWEKSVRPELGEDEANKSSVYFPVADDEHSFNSILGRWRMDRTVHHAVVAFLRAQQPFTDLKNRWLYVLNDLAIQGKHIDLLPQKRVEARQVQVSSGHSSVTYGPGVTFGSGVRILGAPVDPRTQRIVPTAGLHETITIWVSFEIAGHGVNAAAFCRETVAATKRVVQEMTDLFDLS